jgi:hypothetical protein
MAGGITDREESSGLSDTQIEVLAITACRQNHLSGERMCAQCFAIERAIRTALRTANSDKEQKREHKEEEIYRIATDSP